MLDSKPTIPTCGSKHPVKNGRIHNKKSSYHCQNCGRQFGENPTKKVISPSLKDLIDKLLLEKISWAGIARVIGGSEPWLQKYVNAKYAKIPQQFEVSEKLSGLTIECDEAWSFVGNKNNQQWKELAMDVQTREIVGVYVGARSRESALKLWNSLPTVYPLSFRGEALPPCPLSPKGKIEFPRGDPMPPRNTRCQCAVCYTDFGNAYEEVIPKKRHQAVGKESGKTNYIERFNNTLRPRISRLVRKTLSFSKKLENHLGAIWYFIHHYNASLPV